MKSRVSNDCPLVEAAHDREWASRLALSDAIATTRTGLACQVRFAHAEFGEVALRAMSGKPPKYALRARSPRSDARQSVIATRNVWFRVVSRPRKERLTRPFRSYPKNSLFTQWVKSTCSQLHGVRSVMR